MSELNFRRHYDLYLTNTKDNRYNAGPYALLMPAKPTFRGTLKQILAEVAKFRRISGGCAIASKVIDPATNEEISIDRIRTELWAKEDR